MGLFPAKLALLGQTKGSGVAVGGAAFPPVGFCYDQLEIYKSVIFRNLAVICWRCRHRPILDNK